MKAFFSSFPVIKDAHLNKHLLNTDITRRGEPYVLTFNFKLILMNVVKSREA